MAIYRNVEMGFWTDTKVVDDFTPEDKYFYLYLLTNPHTNLAGCYEVSLKTMSDETGYTKDTVERLLDRFANQHKVIKYSSSNKEVYLENWNKHNWTRSEKLDKPLFKDISAVKTKSFREDLMKIYCDRDTVSIPYRYPIDTTVTVINNNTNNIDINNKNNTNTNNYILLNNYSFSEELRECVITWLDYKKEKNQGYKETGLKTLLKQIQKNAEQYSDEAVISAIEKSISSNYQGIAFDLVAKYKPTTNNVSTTTRKQIEALDKQDNDFDEAELEAREREFEEMLARGEIF